LIEILVVVGFESGGPSFEFGFKGHSYSGWDGGRQGMVYKAREGRERPLV
jgi:hypothetical protein